MNRALRAATVGVLLLTPVALTACGVGQVDQTASQVRDHTGPSAKIGDLYLREVQVAAPTGAAYAPGDDAELTMAIVNAGSIDDALVGIRGDGFSGVRVAGTGSSATATGTAASATPATTSAAATPTATALPSGATPGTTTPVTPGATTPATATGTTPATGTIPATGSTPATVSGAPATATAATATATAASTPVNIPIPAHQAVFLGQNAPTVTLVGLRQSLTSAQLMKVTFTFRRAGEVTVDVVVAAPTNPVPPATTYDFSQEPSPVFGTNG